MTMTDQDIFNKVAKHLLTQNKQSEARMPDGSGPACAYRAPEGLMCAAGVLIKDEFYDPNFENLVVGNDEVNEALFKSGVPANQRTFELIRDLQVIHDAGFVSLWKIKLNNVAEEYKLQPVA